MPIRILSPCPWRWGHVVSVVVVGGLCGLASCTRAGFDPRPRAERGQAVERGSNDGPSPDGARRDGAPAELGRSDATEEQAAAVVDLRATLEDRRLDSVPEASPDLGPDRGADLGTPDVLQPSASCPCKGIFDAHYRSLDALLWPTCTTWESSNKKDGIFFPDQYIAASYIDGNSIFTVTIASNSSISPRTANRNSCYVMSDGDAYLAGPITISDADHLACVIDITEREVICKGCNWLQSPCP